MLLFLRKLLRNYVRIAPYCTGLMVYMIDERNGRNMNPKVLTLIAHLCWSVWKECNQCIFKNQKPNPVQVLNSVFAANGKFLDAVY